eukprot:scaffold43775_cov38-Phaeocystis_antarctica.AAC.1
MTSSATASAPPAPTDSLSIATTDATKMVSCSEGGDTYRAKAATITAPATPLAPYDHERGAMTAKEKPRPGACGVAMVSRLSW